MKTDALQCPVEISILDGEYWWGGLTADGVAMPFSAGSTHSSSATFDMKGNQGAPLLVSSLGRYVWCDNPFDFEIKDGRIRVTGSVLPVLLSDGNGHLAGAFRAAARAHFPSSGGLPPRGFFEEPQYNTWIELNHNQTQAGILEYAENLISQGYPPGVLMIDAGWSEYFGNFDFHSGRFPDPKAMMARLKQLGFRVMLWVSPFLSADSPDYRKIRYNAEWFLRAANGRPAILEWWDGYSVHFDLTNPEAVAFFHGKLQALQAEYGIDGYKFDAGDTLHYRERPQSSLNASPAELTEVWARLGLEYPFNEYRASWKCAGTPLVQRLADKSPLWDKTGLASLIPNGIALGLVGHPFICPDMIGGGDYVYFNSAGYRVDEELFIRSAQTSALFPMMQFSCAPWRVLSKEGNALCLAAARLHRQFADLILEEAQSAARTGEPILRPLEYQFPQSGYAHVADQFMLGSSMMVAPNVQRGAKTCPVVIPPGRWTDDRGEVTNGPAEIEVDAPLDRVPHWRLS